MDAIKFLKERVRMCNSFDGCDNCPLQNECLDTEIEAMVNAVEQWSKSHPQKTMMQDFFEKFPDAPKHEDDTPQFPCPSHLGYGNLKEMECEFFQGNCSKCWNRLLEN